MPATIRTKATAWNQAGDSPRKKADSRAAIRARILSSAMAATLREEDDFPVRVPGLQIAMGLRRAVEREGPVDGDLDQAVAGERQQLTELNQQLHVLEQTLKG